MHSYFKEEYNKLKELISESVAKYAQMLTESKRDDLLLPYLELLHKRGDNVSLGQLKTYLLNKFATEFGIHSLSASSNFYLAGVARYYFEGYLTTNKRLNVFYPKFKDKPNTEVCEKLDKLIDFLRNAYIDSVGTKFEQPEDFGTLTLEKLFNKYNKKVFGSIEQRNQKQDENINVSNGQVNKKYTYQIIYNFEEAKPYSQYTQPGAWCITYGQQHFNYYKRRLKIHYIFFLQNGYENIPRKVGKGFTKQKPHDEYGNSMIAVLQSNDSPEPIYITSRWNHGYGETVGTEADHAYTKEEFLNVIGADESILTQCYEQWKKGVENSKNNEGRKLQNKIKLGVMRKFKYAQMMINGGADPKQLFSDCYFLCRQNTNKLTKGMFLVSMTDENDGKWWSIMDRGQIAFDKLMVQDSSYRPQSVDYNDTTLGIRHNDIMLFYNKKKHKFIDLNGAIKFKHQDYTARDSNKDDGFIMVALRGNEIGLIDIQKGEAVKAPNGATMFEAIVSMGRYRHNNNSNVNYSGFIDLYDTNHEKFIKFIYDSSANISFVFSIETKSFLPTYKNASQEGLEIANDIEALKKGYIKYQKASSQPYHFISQLWDINSQNWFSVENTIEFSKINIFKNILIYATEQGTYQEKYFNLTTDKYLTFNGKILIGVTSQAFNNQEWLYIQPEESNHMWNVLIYSPDYDIFYKCPKNDSYINHVYGTDSYGKRCIIAIDGSRYEVPMPKEYAKELNIIRESIKNKFYQTLQLL